MRPLGLEPVDRLPRLTPSSPRATSCSATQRRVSMRKWLLSAAMVALVCPAAQAQMAAPAAQPATGAGEVANGRFLVFFDWNSSQLNAAARSVVAEAAADFNKSGQSQIEVVGHTDTSGSATYNQKLSAGVPTRSGPSWTASGCRNPRSKYPARARTTCWCRPRITCAKRRTGVSRSSCRSPRRRRHGSRAEQAVHRRCPSRVSKPFTFSLGALYGHNFGEYGQADGGGKTQNDLAGAELHLRRLAG